MAQDQTMGGEHPSARAARPLLPAMARGFLNRCPRCGQGRLFARFLGTAPSCSHCGQEFHHHRADDLPAYLVIFLVGHLVVGAFAGVEAIGGLTMWQHMAIWVPVTVGLCLALLRPVKGAVVGLQWAFYLHGFGDNPDRIEDHPER